MVGAAGAVGCVVAALVIHFIVEDCLDFPVRVAGVLAFLVELDPYREGVGPPGEVHMERIGLRIHLAVDHQGAVLVGVVVVAFAGCGHIACEHPSGRKVSLRENAE